MGLRYALNGLLSLYVTVAVFATLAYSHGNHNHNHDHNENHHSENSFLSAVHNRNLNEKERCATEEVPKQKLLEVEAAANKFGNKIGKQNLAAAMDETIEIDLYWNVLKTSDGIGAIEDATIQKQIQILNNAFAGVESSYEACGFTYDNSTRKRTPFHFNLKDVIEIEDDSTTLEPSVSKDLRMSLHQGNCSDLNIFSGRMGGFLGYATFPFDCEDDPLLDGVVINFVSLPEADVSPFNEGDTLVHEVGHWLGLYHTFQGGCLDRDYVIDTAAQSSPTFGCPIRKKSCGDFDDNIHNFMDFSDDCCMYRFTNGQIERMILHAGLYRGLSANVTLPIVTPLTCTFPNDGFNYSSCDVENMCWVGDGFCDLDELSGYNTDQCNFDGQDCVCEFPNDGFNYSSCDVDFPCWIGDGWCDEYYDDEYTSDECNFDGGDCDCEFPNDGFDYSDCDVAIPCWIGDGICDGLEYGTRKCNRDGGDCTALGIVGYFIFAISQFFILLCLFLCF